MDDIALTADVGEDRKLVIDLPEDVPVGPVQLVIRPLDLHTSPETGATREVIRAKLRAAGLLNTAHHSAPKTAPLTPDERRRLGTLPEGARPTSRLIDEDRGPR